MPTLPTPGRIVLFVLPDESPRKGEVRAAFVTGVTDGPSGNQVNLTVLLDQFNDVNTDPAFYPTVRAWSVAYDESGTPGTWHWMPYQVGQAAKTDDVCGKLEARVAALEAILNPTVRTSGFVQVAEAYTLASTGIDESGVTITPPGTIAAPPTVVMTGSTAGDTAQISVSQNPPDSAPGAGQ